MFGGLYGDLPAPSSAPKKEEETKGEERLSATQRPGPPSWSVSKMAPPTLRKASLFAAPPSVLKNQSGALRPKAPAVLGSARVAPVPASTPPKWNGEAATAGSCDYGGAHSPVPPPAIQVSAPGQPALVATSAAVMEEYDPARPNDYEEYCRERRMKKMEEERRREMERRRKEDEEREKEREREMQRLRDLERAREAEAGQEPSEARARLNISGEEAWKRRAMLSGGRAAAMDTNGGRTERSPSPPKPGEGLLQGKPGGGLGLGAGGQMSAAERMMAKMGWKAGQGLGKQEQGITTPLMARKTDKRAGVIVNASPLEKEKEKEREREREKEKGQQPMGTPGGAVKVKGGTSLSGPPTRVLLLRNMVGPGEVDDELEDEVAGECAKYGTVTRVLIFEITEEGYPSTEAVRIFIQFERPESSLKAMVDLDGRFFGGRTVKATFFEEDRFGRHELGPAPGEQPA